MMKDQKGTSLVSVIVSFAVLMIVLLLLQVSITASGRYAARAKDIWEEAAEAERIYVNGGGSLKPGDGMLGFTVRQAGGNNQEETWGHMSVYVTDTASELPLYYIKSD